MHHVPHHHFDSFPSMGLDKDKSATVHSLILLGTGMTGACVSDLASVRDPNAPEASSCTVQGMATAATGHQPCNTSAKWQRQDDGLPSTGAGKGASSCLSQLATHASPGPWQVWPCLVLHGPSLGNLTAVHAIPCVLQAAA